VAVLKAIKSGRLAGAAEKRGGRWVINPDLADRAWSDNTDSLEADKSASQKGRPRKKATKKKSAATPEREAALPQGAPEVTFPEVGGPGETGALFGRDALPDEPADPAASPDDGPTTMAKANASKTAWQAELSRLQVQELQKLLVRSSDVDAEVFRIFQTLRKQLEAISKRVDANLAAADDRLVCRKILDEEIAMALSSVAAKCGADGQRRQAS